LDAMISSLVILRCSREANSLISRTFTVQTECCH
jgi:hypothetical protein